MWSLHVMIDRDVDFVICIIARGTSLQLEEPLYCGHVTIGTAKCP